MDTTSFARLRRSWAYPKVLTGPGPASAQQARRSVLNSAYARNARVIRAAEPAGPNARSTGRKTNETIRDHSGTPVALRTTRTGRYPASRAAVTLARFPKSLVGDGVPA
jgi:hypothetical protein